MRHFSALSWQARPYSRALARLPFLLLGGPSALVAQQSARPAADSAADSIAVHAQRLAPQVVSATRLATGQAAATAGRVDALGLRDTPSGPAMVASALGRLTGVAVFDDQGTRAQPSLDLRGFELSPVVGTPQGVSVFLDGIRINEADAQQVAFDLIPVAAVDSAQVIRGPGALYGKNTLGGAVLLTTARGQPGESRVDATASGAAFGYRGAHVLASTAGNSWDALALVRATDESGFRYGTPARTRQAFANFGHRGAGSDVVLTLLGADDRIAEAGSLPESWLRVDPRLNYTSGDFVAPTLLHAALRGEWHFGPSTLRANVYGRRNDTEQFNANVDEPSTRSFIRVGSLGSTVETTIPLAGAALTVGAEGAHHRVHYRLLAEPTASAPDLPADCDSDGVCELAHTTEDDAAAFAQLQLPIAPTLTGTLAARSDWVRLPFRDDRDPANDGTGVYHRFSPRAALAWQPNDALHLYGSVGTGFRAPAALELACADESAPCPLPFSLGDDPPLAPVTVVSSEVGGSWSLSRLTMDASLYRADSHDEIVFAASTRTAGYFRNVPHLRRQGAELSARAALGGGVRAFGSWSFVDATYRSTIQLASAIPDEPAAQPGDRLPLVPPRRARAGLGITRLLGAFVADGELAANATSSTFLRGDEANVHPPVPGHTTLDARLRVVHAHAELAVAVENLLDERYQTFGVYALNPLGDPGGPRPADPTLERFLTPGYPRQLTVSVTTKW